MDPNETLAMFRTALLAEDWESAADNARALDQWITKGGFLPTEWDRAPQVNPNPNPF